MTEFEQLSERYYSTDRPIWTLPNYKPIYMKYEIGTLYKELETYIQSYKMGTTGMELCSSMYLNSELKDKLKL